MSIRLQLDQHRRQITADRLDTETGEVKRGRVTPADCVGVRRSCERFGGRGFDVAVGRTRARRFAVEELRRVGAIGNLPQAGGGYGVAGSS